MSSLLDTNIVSTHMKQPTRLAHRFIQHSGRLAIPSIVLAELYAGAHLRSDPEPLLRQIADLLVAVTVLDFDPSCAEQFGRLRGELKRLGVGVGPMDLMIASVALAHGMTLVTHNTAHFAPIPGLVIEDWLSP
jgi:tRNA(fMet)-specific endonuclease VapC